MKTLLKVSAEFLQANGWKCYKNYDNLAESTWLDMENDGSLLSISEAFEQCTIGKKVVLQETGEKMKTLSQVQKEVNQLPEDMRGLISDGYHTFDELYEFRMLYNAMYANLLAEGVGIGTIHRNIDVYKSLRHDDGGLCFGGGWFIVVIKLMTGKEIRNHYPIANWDLFHVPERYSAIDYDGHTSEDVAKRMREFLEFSK